MAVLPREPIELLINLEAAKQLGLERHRNYRIAPMR
jgi:hypothetical protein